MKPRGFEVVVEGQDGGGPNPNPIPQATTQTCPLTECDSGGLVEVPVTVNV